MTNWLYPANSKYYDVQAAFAKASTYWPAKSKVNIGDRIYIYLAAPHQQIAFVGEVSQIDLTESAIIHHIDKFFKTMKQQSAHTTSFMKINKIKRIPIQEQSPLKLQALKANGLKGMLMGPRKLDNNRALLSHIQEYLP